MLFAEFMFYEKRKFANNWPHTPPHINVIEYISFFQGDCDGWCFFNPPFFKSLNVMRYVSKTSLKRRTILILLSILRRCIFILGTNYWICETSSTHSRKARNECIWILLLPIAEFSSKVIFFLLFIGFWTSFIFSCSMKTQNFWKDISSRIQVKNELNMFLHSSDREKGLFSVAWKFQLDAVQQVTANPIRGRTETGQAFEFFFCFWKKET